MKQDGAETAWQFLSDIAGRATRPQLALIAFVQTIDIALVVATGTAGMSGWRAFAVAAGSVILLAGLEWMSLSSGRVQRWIKGHK